MFGQSLGSMIVAFECFTNSLLSFDTPFPDIFCDTTGASYTYIISKYYNCINIPYVHYPTITEDMFRKVREMRPTYNNNQMITNNTTVSSIKIIYYQCFAYTYSFIMNYLTDLIIVNGSWTEYHLKRIMFELQDSIKAEGISTITSNKVKSIKHTKADDNGEEDEEISTIDKCPIVKIYPPCNTELLLNMNSNSNGDSYNYITNGNDVILSRKPIIISVGQYRPEKDQLLQIKAFHTMLIQYER